MKLVINYIENEIIFKDGTINVLEIENKKYFYRIINDLNKIANGDIDENIKFIDSNFEEVDFSNKIKLVIDYFNIELNDKKTINEIEKYILKNSSDSIKKGINNNYSKILNYYKAIAKQMELPISYNEDVQYDKLVKNMGFSIDNKHELLDNLLLLIDIEKTFNFNRLIIFINLKQYLNYNELIELYKYSIYNNIKILLIDSFRYKSKIGYENKITIDNDLDEFVI